MPNDSTHNVEEELRDNGDRERKALGERLKALRKRRLLTITQLSLYTGFSVGYLSNVERGQTSPTVDNLKKICYELEVPITEVLASQADEVECIRKGDCKVDERPDEGMTIATYAFGGAFDPYCIIRLEPGEYKFEEAMHPFSETCYVMSGRLYVKVDDREYHLEAGDSISVHSNYRHAMRNDGDVPCESLWFHTNVRTRGVIE